jgi:hyperosmotically inducible protein
MQLDKECRETQTEKNQLMHRIRRHDRNSLPIRGVQQTGRLAIQHPRLESTKDTHMKYARAFAFAAMAAATIVTATGCAVARDQQTVGAYMDDAGITTAVKAKMAEDKTVSATAISVETLNGTVQLSGFAKSQAEKNQAESIARNTKHVRDVRNSIVVRP